MIEVLLRIEDPDAIRILESQPEDEREQYALNALSVGLRVMESTGPNAYLVNQVIGEVRGLMEHYSRPVGGPISPIERGVDYEKQLLHSLTQLLPDDVVSAIGNKPGKKSSSKVGDILVTLGADKRAPGAVIVVEAKTDQSYTPSKALEEMEAARINRQADAAVMVFSPEALHGVGLSHVPFRLAPNGKDILVGWDPDNLWTNGVLRAGLALARNACAYQRHAEFARQVDVGGLKRSVSGIEQEIEKLSAIEKSALTIRKEADKQDDVVRKLRTGILALTESITQEVGE